MSDLPLDAPMVCGDCGRQIKLGEWHTRDGKRRVCADCSNRDLSDYQDS